SDKTSRSDCPVARPVGPDLAEGRLVYGVLQCLARLEARDFGGFDLDRLTGLRVTTGTSSAFLDSEGTEAHQDNGIICLQSTSNGFDHSVQRTTSNGFRDISRCGDGIDQFRLVHSKSPYLTLMKLFFTINTCFRRPT